MHVLGDLLARDIRHETSEWDAFALEVLLEPLKPGRLPAADLGRVSEQTKASCCQRPEVQRKSALL